MSHKLTQKDKDDLISLVNKLKNSTDDQIDLSSEEITAKFINEKEMFYRIVPLFGYISVE